MGGEDIDNALLTLFLEDCQVNHPNFDARENKKGLARLKKAAFDVKGLLSQENESEASADGISGDTDFVYDVTRVVFEERCQPIFDKIVPIIDQTLQDCNLDKTQIDDVVIVGGSTRIPKVRKIIRQHFGKEPKQNLNPDLVVAEGATILAGILQNAPGLNGFSFKDVTTFAIGIEILQDGRDVMKELIAKNTQIPCQATQKVKTVKENQSRIKLRILQGENG